MKDKMTLDKLAGMMMERFEGVGEKFVSLREDMDERFDKVNERFDKVDTTMKHGFAEQSSRLTSVERRTTILEAH